MSGATARATLEVARALESRPEIAAAAHAGELSWDQLQPLVEVATPDTDAEWAQRGPNCAPIDLQRLARRREVTAEEAAARREARSSRIWWRRDVGMLSIRGELPDADGALAESVLERMIDRMRPAKGQHWDTRAHRLADAFVDLCANYADADAATTGKSRPHIIVQVPAGSRPEINGVPIARTILAALVADARVE